MDPQITSNNQSFIHQVNPPIIYQSAPQKVRFLGRPGPEKLDFFGNLADSKKITLLPVIPTMTCQDVYLDIYLIYFDILFDIYSGIYSGILSGIYPDIPPGILSGSLSGILSDIFSDISSDIYSGILPVIYSDIYSGILSDIYSGILSGIISDIYFGILSDIYSGIYGPVLRLSTPPPWVGSPGSNPQFPSICKLLAAFLRSSVVFARSLQHF